MTFKRIGELVDKHKAVKCMFCDCIIIGTAYHAGYNMRGKIFMCSKCEEGYQDYLSGSGDW